MSPIANLLVLVILLLASHIFVVKIFTKEIVRLRVTVLVRAHAEFVDVR